MRVNAERMSLGEQLYPEVFKLHPDEQIAQKITSCLLQEPKESVQGMVMDRQLLQMKLIEVMNRGKF